MPAYNEESNVMTAHRSGKNRNPRSRVEYMSALSGGRQVEPAPVLGEMKSGARSHAFSKKLVVQERNAHTRNQ